MKKKNTEENYLERIPVRSDDLPWKTDENGFVTVEVENKGAMNKIAQKFFKKPKIAKFLQRVTARQLQEKSQKSA